MTIDCNTAAEPVWVLTRHPAGLPRSLDLDREIYSRMFEQLGICMGVGADDMCHGTYLDYLRDDLVAAGLGDDVEPNDDRQWEFACPRVGSAPTPRNAVWLRTRCLCIVLSVMAIHACPRDGKVDEQLAYVALYLLGMAADGATPLKDPAAARALGPRLVQALTIGAGEEVYKLVHELVTAITGDFPLSKYDIWG